MEMKVLTTPGGRIDIPYLDRVERRRSNGCHVCTFKIRLIGYPVNDCNYK